MAKPMLEKQDSFDKAERKISLRRTVSSLTILKVYIQTFREVKIDVPVCQTR